MEVEFGGCSSWAWWVGSSGGQQGVLWWPETAGGDQDGTATAMTVGWQ